MNSAFSITFWNDEWAEPGSARDQSHPTVILGDFNQRVPRVCQPKAVFSALGEALSGFEIVTAGPIAGAPNLSIDHLATANTLQPMSVEHLSSYSDSGTRMSDHFGLRVFLQSPKRLTKVLLVPR